MLKKIISILMIIMLVFSIPVTTFADTISQMKDKEQKEVLMGA